jgi:hypothetical protein
LTFNFEIDVFHKSAPYFFVQNHCFFPELNIGFSHPRFKQTHLILSILYLFVCLMSYKNHYFFKVFLSEKQKQNSWSCVCLPPRLFLYFPHFQFSLWAAFQMPITVLFSDPKAHSVSAFQYLCLKQSKQTFPCLSIKM